MTQTRKSVSMWFADPQQTIKSNNAKVPLLVTLQHSNQNKLWTGLIRQRHCTPNQKFIIIMGGKHKSLTISFCCKSAEYPLHCRNRRSGITPTIWLTISIFTRYFKDLVWYCANKLVDFFVIHSLFPSRQLSLAPPRESQPYLQNESCSTLSFYVHQLIVSSIQSL